MSQPVWVLSVDLQTKTAVFQSNLKQAAQSARGAFGEIASGSQEMSLTTSYSMMEARHSVMMLGEEFGVRLPRALSSFIAGLGPIGPALEMAFPFLAIAGLATILIDHLQKIHEAGEKLTADQIHFGTAVNNVFNTLDDKILQAQIRTDELAHNHLGALQKQLELIDHESMAELIHAFEEIAKAADVVMKDLEGHWYTFGKGSEGAKHALDGFQAQYESLISQGQEEKANGLLHGTLTQAQHILDLLKTPAAVPSGNHANDDAAYEKATKAHQELAALGISTGITLDKQVEAQQNLVDALNAQLGVEQRIATLKQLEGSNIKTADAQSDDKSAKERARQLEEAEKAGREVYLKELFETNKEAVAAVQQGEKENIEATKSGSQERLQAIQDAMAREEADGLQGTAFYRELYEERAELEQKLADESRTRAGGASTEAAKQDAAMGELRLQAQKSADTLQLSSMRNTALARLADDQRTADEAFAIKRQALEQEMTALDQSNADYSNKLKELQNKEVLLTQQHENEITAIKDKAEEERNQRVLSAEQRFQDQIASGLTKSIMGHQTWAKTIDSLGDQMVSGMIENAMKSMLADDMTKERDAAAAARKAFNAGMSFPFPANIVMGPVLGAAAFASVMAFNTGGIVPGYGSGDTVPALLTPGETVLPKGLSDSLNNAAKGGSLGGDKHYHAHIRPTYNVNTIDGDGMQDVLTKHSDQLTRHVENTLRRMNH